MLTFACYTEGTSYEDEAKLLAASLDNVGMTYRLVPYQDGGDWYANTARKAEIIREVREGVYGPLLYLDADQFVHVNCESYLERLEGVDFAAHWFAGPDFGHDRSDVCGCIAGGECTKAHRLISSAMYLGDTDGCRRLLANWCALNELWRDRGIMEGGGQKNLWFTLTCMRDGLTQARLPGRFCYIFDKTWAYPPDEPCWITHTIASRENRDAGAGTVKPKRQAKIQELKEVLRGD